MNQNHSILFNNPPPSVNLDPNYDQEPILQSSSPIDQPSNLNSSFEEYTSFQQSTNHDPYDYRNIGPAIVLKSYQAKHHDLHLPSTPGTTPDLSPSLLTNNYHSKLNLPHLIYFDESIYPQSNLINLNQNSILSPSTISTLPNSHLELNHQSLKDQLTHCLDNPLSSSKQFDLSSCNYSDVTPSDYSESTNFTNMFARDPSLSLDQSKSAAQTDSCPASKASLCSSDLNPPIDTVDQFQNSKIQSLPEKQPSFSTQTHHHSLQLDLPQTGLSFEELVTSSQSAQSNNPSECIPRTDSESIHKAKIESSSLEIVENDLTTLNQSNQFPINQSNQEDQAINLHELVHQPATAQPSIETLQTNNSNNSLDLVTKTESNSQLKNLISNEPVSTCTLNSEDLVETVIPSSIERVNQFIATPTLPSSRPVSMPNVSSHFSFSETTDKCSTIQINPSELFALSTTTPITYHFEQSNPLITDSQVTEIFKPNQDILSENEHKELIHDLGLSQSIDINHSNSHPANISCNENSQADLAFNQLNPINLISPQSSTQADAIINISEQVTENHSEGLNLLPDSTDPPIKGQTDNLHEETQEETSTDSAQEPSKPANNSLSLGTRARSMSAFFRSLSRKDFIKGEFGINSNLKTEDRKTESLDKGLKKRRSLGILKRKSRHSLVGKGSNEPPVPKVPLQVLEIGKSQAPTESPNSDHESSGSIVINQTIANPKTKTEVPNTPVKLTELSRMPTVNPIDQSTSPNKLLNPQHHSEIKPEDNLNTSTSVEALKEVVTELSKSPASKISSSETKERKGLWDLKTPLTKRAFKSDSNRASATSSFFQTNGTPFLSVVGGIGYSPSSLEKKNNQNPNTNNNGTNPSGLNGKSGMKENRWAALISKIIGRKNQIDRKPT
ncbi:hypothetical protein O181_039686 [Austropuccinia psidii MF-1]|uniref:Uncharacterized protein n=1 Tax=Austropuccinia psidii MF-1 TaxID=1389203 RepID=A0A9Q3DGD6_9BASI|nr:hypothetical protein [Austropuccinia psidii MF-1]